MSNRRSFKSTASFLEKLAIGAIGTTHIFNNLAKQGHTPIELERGSMSYKIWREIKIKRIRVPDLFCVKCGRSVESRTKTSLEISMSHSLSDPERGWDYGLNDNDFIAFAVCKKVGNRPIDWQPLELIQYFLVKDLRLAYKKNKVNLTGPKGAQEGFERRIIWPTVVANYPGKVALVSKEKIQYKRKSDGRTITLRLRRNENLLEPVVRTGEDVVVNQILASTVPVFKGIKCEDTISVSHYLKLLSTPSLSERYKATKALSFFKEKRVIEALLKIVRDEKEHIYIRLEAAASLMKQHNEEGVKFMLDCLKSEYLQNKLETIIVLGEICSDDSIKILIDVLMDEKQHPEIRAGAAWALGEIKSKDAIGALIKSFSEIEENIRIEAARALFKIAQRYSKKIIQLFPSASLEERPGIAWAISKAKKFSLNDIISILKDNDARQWAAYILGTQDPEDYIHEIELLREKDSEVYFATTVLWKILNSWIYNLEEFG